MAATIPTLQQLYETILANLEAELDVDIPVFGKYFLRVLSAVLAAAFKLIYLAIANVQKNVFVDTAETENIGGTLERFGRVKIGRNPFPATEGEYIVSANGTAASVVSAGQTFKADDGSAAPGKLFIIEESFTMVTDPDTFTLKALEGGLDSRLNIGDTLTATSPIAGVDSVVEVTIESVTPLAAEDLEDYRDKVIEAFQSEPQGGAASDYRIWSADAQGVARVYPYMKSGTYNEIDLFVEATEADSIDGKGTPTGAILTEVQSVVEFDPDETKSLNLRGRKPLTVNQIHYTAITALDVDITITNFQNLDADTSTAISNALTAVCQGVRPFVAAADVEANRNDTLSINKLIAAVQDVISGSQSFDSLTMEIDSVPVAISQQFTDGNIPYFNSLTIT